MDVSAGRQRGPRGGSDVLLFLDEGTWEVVLPFLLRASVAGICGALIGLERELRGKAAGFRTNMLICLGAAVFMTLSELVAAGAAPGRMSDPGRIAAQVVTGVGFLGAGAILHSGGAVRGMTSAAMIWVVAAVGLAAGAGYVQLALITTGLTLVATSLLGLFEGRFRGRCELAACRLVIAPLTDVSRRQLEGILREHDVELASVSFERRDDATVVIFGFCRAHERHRRVLAELWRLPGIVELRPAGRTTAPSR
jgi:putative Mg2+ transporter-C (MgtC) family protein